jgi:hypothetical protein
VATVLDEAIARLYAGEALENILTDHSAWAEEIRPVLEAAAAIAQTPRPIPNLQKKHQGRERLLRAVATQREIQYARRSGLAQVREAGRSLEEVLDEALGRLRDGEDLETVLAGYPAYATQMRPLLLVAAGIQQIPHPVPSEAAYFAGRARIVKLAAQRRKQLRAAEPSAALRRATLVLPARTSGGILQGFLGLVPGFRRAAMTVVMLAIMILGGFSVTRVAADSMPTSPLYPVKRFTEQVQLAIASSAEEKAKLHLQFGQERLREADYIVRQSGELETNLLHEMGEHGNRFLETIKDLNPEQQQRLLEEGINIFRQQRRQLTELSDEDSLLAAPEREAARDFAGEAGDRQAIAEELQREPGKAQFVPAPSPISPPTEAPKPEPTLEPTKVQELVRPTSEPATATPEPATATPTGVLAEMGMDPIGPAEQPVEPTVIGLSTEVPPAAAVEPPPSQPSEPEATATPVPVEAEDDLPPSEIVLPTVPAESAP